jgi:hypothetical protein
MTQMLIHGTTKQRSMTAHLRWTMNPAISCIEDTLRLLLEEAMQAKATAAAKCGSPAEGFEVGRSEALAESLHTWANQLLTFGLDKQLDGTWKELRAFLASQGY